MSDSRHRYGLGEAIGVEIEYQIVDPETANWQPIADHVLVDADGSIVDEVAFEDLAFCNELAAHIVEIKCPTPRASFDGIAEEFDRAVAHLDRRLSASGARLLPGGAHPFESPAHARLWPHAYGEVYEAFDRLFGCDGHGWVNLQSVQINLSFRGDDEFRRLHSAIRCILPLLPALSASTPFLDGRHRGQADERLRTYATNSSRVPSVTGDVIPRVSRSEADYVSDVLEPIGAAIREKDPQGVLDPEFVNARGALPRFSRGSIEIRTLDAQEHVRGDLAILFVIERLVHALVEERISPLATQEAVPQGLLLELHDQTIERAERADLVLSSLAPALGLGSEWNGSARTLWRELVDRHHLCDGIPAALGPALEHILDQGSLATRMLAAIGTTPDRVALRALCGDLHACLVGATPFSA